MDLKIFTENIEQEALSQVYELLSQDAFKDCKVRIMPDAHAGKGCVIGFTADLGDKVIPNIVGVDIGCGMLTVELGNIDIDLEKLDDFIRVNIPNGRDVNEKSVCKYDIGLLRCYPDLKNIERIGRSIGSLGGGNHFIEIDIDDDENKYLVVHTGSRNLGKQVAELYQKIAFDNQNGKKEELNTRVKTAIQLLQSSGGTHLIENRVKQIKSEYLNNVPKDLCYLEDSWRQAYLHDMKLCQEYAVLNRKYIASSILDFLKTKRLKHSFETIHNYIDLENNIVRKGAVSAKLGEKLLIPINMRDGCILGVGKGNEDWNYSAPHGAGRIMSRTRAKAEFNIEDFKDSMDGIYTTSVNKDTIDESPMAYKKMEEIVDNIKDTVDILKIIKPIYNFKASE